MAGTLIAQPAATVVRRLSLRLLKEAEAAGARLDHDDAEALHDFRVATRRLRTLLRAYKDLSLVPDKAIRRLRTLAHATNDARDLEVALQNLRELEEQGPVVASLDERIEARYARVRADTLEEVKAAWPGLSDRLHKALDAATGPSAPAFGEVASRLVTAEWNNLQRMLETLRAEWHDEAAHRARLAGKRLRYLLEPLAAELPPASEAVAALKAFQDHFGLYHDLWLLLGLIAELAAEAAAVNAHARVRGAEVPPVPVEHYAALAERLRRERHRQADRLKADYLAPDSGALRAVAAALDALASR